MPTTDRLDSLMARRRAKFKRVCPDQVIIETVLGPILYAGFVKWRYKSYV
jgi:hypothetical protein